MKKYFPIFLLIFCSQAGYGQSVNQLFDEFAHQKHAEHMKISPFTMRLSSVFTETMGVKSIEVIDLEACDNQVKKELHQKIKNLKDPEFETILTQNGQHERTKIMVRIKKEAIRDLVILTSDDSDVSLIRIKGKIKPENVEKVITEHKNEC